MFKDINLLHGIEISNKRLKENKLNVDKKRERVVDNFDIK